MRPPEKPTPPWKGAAPKENGKTSHLNTAPSPRPQGWRTFRRLMVERLSTILSCPLDQLPCVFLATKFPRPLKLGIDKDLIVRFPKADTVELRRWLRWWTQSHHYVRRLCAGNNRHDLDGADVERIAAGHAARARRQLKPRKPPAAAASAPTRPILSLRARVQQ
jgi:hypothetical protein